MPNQSALALVEPQLDGKYILLVQDANHLAELAATLTVQSEADVATATGQLSFIATVKKNLELLRREYLTPLKEATDKVNAAFKSLSEPVNAADTDIRGKVLTFKRVEEDKRREVDRIAQAKVDLARDEAKLAGEPEPAEALVPVQLRPPALTRTETGSSTTATIRKWRVIDQSLVPEEYKVVDAGRVTKQVKAGIGSIPGIEIYTEDILKVEAVKQ